MAAYSIQFDGKDTLKVGFGEPAQNNEIVKHVDKVVGAMVSSGILTGGPVIKVNGPASLPVAVVLAHHLTHLYGTVAVYDPKLNQYVVAANHGGAHAVGDLID